MFAEGCVRLSFTAYFDDVSQFQYYGLYVKLWALFLGNAMPGLEDENAHEILDAMATTFRFQELPDGFELEIDDAGAGSLKVKGHLQGIGEPETPLLIRYFWAAWEDEAFQQTLARWKSIAEAAVDPNDLDAGGRAEKTIAEAISKGLRFSQTCSMPGEIKDATGWTSTDGRTARLSLLLGGWPDPEALPPELRETLADIGKTHLARKIVCGPRSVSDDAVARFHREVEQAKAAREHEKVEAMRRVWPDVVNRARRSPGTARQILRPLVEKDPQGAIGAAETALERYPTVAKMILQLIIEKDPGSERCKKAQELLGKERAPVLLQAARALLKADKVDAARKRLDEITTEYPNHKAAPGAREVLELLDDDKVKEAAKRLEEIIHEHVETW
ncbi:MAG: tetratricopeptide repeat protein [Planctomycetota bacterium]|jgi:hypothetical protein